MDLRGIIGKISMQPRPNDELQKYGLQPGGGSPRADTARHISYYAVRPVLLEFLHFGFLSARGI